MDQILFSATRKGLWCAIVAVAAFGGGVARAHEGESHDQPAMATATSPDSARRSFSGSGDAVELTLVYDTTTVHPGAPVPLRLLLADKFTNEPMDGATLDLTLSGGEGDTNLAAAPSGAPGVYAISATLTAGKPYSLLVDVTKGSVSDFFSLDGIALPESEQMEHTGDTGAADRKPRALLPWIGAVAGAAFVGFLAGRASRHEQKAGAK